MPLVAESRWIPYSSGGKCIPIGTLFPACIALRPERTTKGEYCANTRVDDSSRKKK